MLLALCQDVKVTKRYYCVDVVTSNMCYNIMVVTPIFYMLEHLLCAISLLDLKLTLVVGSLIFCITA